MLVPIETHFPEAVIPFVGTTVIGLDQSDFGGQHRRNHHELFIGISFTSVNKCELGAHVAELYERKSVKQVLTRHYSIYRIQNTIIWCMLMISINQ